MKKVKEKALMRLLDKIHKYKKMLSYFLKCKKIQKFQEFQKLVVAKQCYYQNLLYVVLKNKIYQSSLGIKTLLSKTYLLGNILF